MQSAVNASCPEVWSGVPCGAHGTCEPATGTCICNIPGWQATAEFSTLGWNRLVCDYHVWLPRGIAMMGVMVNLASLLVQSYVTSDRAQLNQNRQTFVGFACGLALSLQRLVVPLSTPLMGTDPVHTALLASYTSCLIGTVLTFLCRFAVAIRKSSVSAISSQKGAGATSTRLKSLQVNERLPGLLIATERVTHVGMQVFTVCSIYFGSDERVWAAGYYSVFATIFASCSFTAIVDIYTTAHTIRDLEAFLRLEQELRHEVDDSDKLRRSRRIRRNIGKLRFLQRVVGSFFALVAFSALCAIFFIQVMYAAKYLFPFCLHLAVLVISVTTLLLYFGGLRHSRRSRKVQNSQNSAVSRGSVSR
jgi:hypothetical protein